VERCNQNYNPNLKAKKKKRKKFRMAAWRGSLTINVESQQKGVCIFGGAARWFPIRWRWRVFWKKRSRSPLRKNGPNPLKGRPIQAGRKGEQLGHGAPVEDF
jgi:hypothetical protein